MKQLLAVLFVVLVVAGCSEWPTKTETGVIKSIHHIGGEEPTMAITFDDGRTVRYHRWLNGIVIGENYEFTIQRRHYGRWYWLDYKRLPDREK